MINKLSIATPAFTSKVNVVFSPDKHYQQYYKSSEMGDQLIELSQNGNDDIVNIYPGKRGGWGKTTTMRMQVLKKGEDGQLLSCETEIYAPHLVTDAYERTTYFNDEEISCDEVVGDFLASEPKEHYNNRPRKVRHSAPVLPPFGGDGPRRTAKVVRHSPPVIPPLGAYDGDDERGEDYREATRNLAFPAF